MMSKSPGDPRRSSDEVPRLGLDPTATASSTPRPVGELAGVYEIALSGRVYADVVPRLALVLQRSLTDGMCDLLIDARALRQLDFAGMDMLAQLQQELSAHDGRIVLHGLHSDVGRMLELTGLARAMPAFDTRDQALAYLDSHRGAPTDAAALREVIRRIHVLARALPPEDYDADPLRLRLARAALAALNDFIGQWGVPEGPNAADAIRRDARELVERLARDWTPRPSDEDVAHVSALVEADLLGNGPLDFLINDPSISEIMVNGPRRVLIERDGRLERTDLAFRDEAHLEHTIRRIAESIGRRIDYANPTLDAYLPDGSRVHAVLPPIALDGASLSIRKFWQTPAQLEDLILHGTLTPEMAYFLSAAVKGRLNIVISGPASSGKTTTMNALASLVPSGERIVTIEEIAEMDLSRAHAHVVRLQPRIANVEGKGEVPTRQLVREALRMRADRILVGEARGAEMVEVLQAMRCGHDGSMTTIHASGPDDLIERSVTLALFANLGLSDATLRRMVLDAIDVVVHMHRFPDGMRRIVTITEPARSARGELELHDVFVFEHEGYDDEGRSVGHHRYVQPSRFRDQLARQGIDIPWDAFANSASGGASVVSSPEPT